MLRNQIHGHVDVAFTNPKREQRRSLFRTVVLGSALPRLRFGLVDGARSPRSGFTLLELFVATVLFGAVLATFLPLMKSVAQTQRATDRQKIALREANNLLEQIAPRPWSELTAEALSQIKLPESVKSHLPSAELKIDVSEQTEPVAAKRVAVQLSWLPQPGRPTESVRLAAWFTKREVQP